MDGAVLRRFHSFIGPQSHDCWPWMGALDENGYGRIRVEGKRPKAHRASYEHYVGPIPADLTLDHLCRNRACVNPEHLEPVTLRENTRRGPRHLTARARYEAQAEQLRARGYAECVRGHAVTADNTYISPAGEVTCRTCRAEVYEPRRRAN